MITDAQVHLWGPPTPERPWDPNAKPHLPEPMTAERWLPYMEEAGVDRVVCNPLYLPGHAPYYGLEVARRYPDKFRVCGLYWPSYANADREFEEWCEDPGLCSVRLNLSEPSHVSMQQEGKLEHFWDKIERLHQTVSISRGEGGIVPLLEPIAQRHPGARIVVDHINFPSTVEVRDSRMAELEALAKYPNVAVKVSTLARFSVEPPPFLDIQPMLKRIHAAYGANRMLWGSDQTQPSTSSKATYRQQVDIIRVEAAKWLTPEEVALVLNGAVEDWFNWPAA